jgi:hypothetical protein
MFRAINRGVTKSIFEIYYKQGLLNWLYSVGYTYINVRF